MTPLMWCKECFVRLPPPATWRQRRRYCDACCYERNKARQRERYRASVEVRERKKAMAREQHAKHKAERLVQKREHYYRTRDKRLAYSRHYNLVQARERWAQVGRGIQ